MTISGSHKAKFPLPDSANELFQGGGLGMAVLDCHRSSDSLDKMCRARSDGVAAGGRARRMSTCRGARHSSVWTGLDAQHPLSDLELWTCATLNHSLTSLLLVRR